MAETDFEKNFPSLKGMRFTRDTIVGDVFSWKNVMEFCIDKAIVERDYIKKEKVNERLKKSLEIADGQDCSCEQLFEGECDYCIYKKALKELGL